jgi:3-oxoadipate enol-lactonase
MGTFNVAKMADLRNLNTDGPTVDEVRRSGVPICLLAGELDAVLSAETVRAAAQLLAEARLELVPNAPHSMYWEAPELFNAALMRFLDQVFADTSSTVGAPA